MEMDFLSPKKRPQSWGWEELKAWRIISVFIEMVEMFSKRVEILW
jgi:hypothetical protein